MSDEERIELYTRLFEGRRSAIRGFLMKQYGGAMANDVDDIVQDTYLQGRNSFAERTVKVFNSWIITCALSAANMHLRKTRRHARNAAALHAEPDPDLYLIGSVAGPHEAKVASEHDERILRYVEALPERLSQAVGLLLMGFSYKEIAERLGITYEALKSRIHRAKHGFAEEHEAIAA